MDLAGGLVRQDPSLHGSIVWGALTLDYVSERWAGHVLGCWEQDHGSLRTELSAHAEDDGHAVAVVPGARNPISL